LLVESDEPKKLKVSTLNALLKIVSHEIVEPQERSGPNGIPFSFSVTFFCIFLFLPILTLDPILYIYTSGTTGLPKVFLKAFQFKTNSESLLRLILIFSLQSLNKVDILAVDSHSSMQLTLLQTMWFMSLCRFIMETVMLLA
jgi:hypothetical protein